MNGLFVSIWQESTSFSSLFDWSEEENYNKLGKSFSPSLNDEQVGYSQHFYRQANADDDSLCRRYSEERYKAVKRHKLRCFPPINKWTPLSGHPLSEKEKLMCLEPSRQIHIMNIVSYEVLKERVIKLTSERCSMSATFWQCYVFFSRSFCGVSKIFAYIKWCGNLCFDTISSFYSVYTNTSLNINPVVPVSTLAGPFVVAVDLIDVNRLCILNYNQFFE